MASKGKEPIKDPKEVKESKDTISKGTVRKKLVSKNQISEPTGFSHIAHTDARDAKKFLEALALKNAVDYDYSTVKIKKMPEEMGGDDEENTGRSRSSIPWLGSSFTKPQNPSSSKVFSDEEADSESDVSDSEGEESAAAATTTEGAPVSEGTEERVVVAKIWMENYYDRLFRATNERGNRRDRLETQLAKSNVPDEEREALRTALLQKESDHTRLRRKKVSVNHFEDIKIIGKGAFGLVKLVVEKGSRDLYAMKIIRKEEVIKKKQEGHIRAERDIMAAASHLDPIVKLYHSFQDKENLYFVMEYMAGGDLLNLLIKKDIFPESFAKAYMSQMVVAVDTVHSLGFIHRDIKPDNFLLTPEGHLKVSDFGLCTGFHWAHDAKFYETQRKIALKKMDKDATDPKAPGQAATETFIDQSKEPKDNILKYRDQNQRSLAYSVVGTNNYIAPEVLLQVGYNRECDWWSLGIILFEMLFGFPPFCSENRQTTKLKIINWQKTFKFPQKPKVSDEAKDLISKLICDPQDRLGRNGGEEVKSHPFFKGIDWDNIYKNPAPWRPELTSPIDTCCFDEIKPPEWVNNPTPAMEADYNLYGFTYRGFYNLTRKGESENENGERKMDPLQAAVLAMLAEDKKLAEEQAVAEKRRSRSSTF